MIAEDLWLLLKCLAREILRQPLRSNFAIVPFSTTSDGCRAAGQRALAVLYVSTTPNSIVLDIDAEQKQMFYHQLEPARIPELVRQLQD
jgi:multisubunit Na+/H+ antiporter MnhE subunit